MKIHGIFMDLTTLTEDTTIIVYYKIDGTTYREIERMAWTFGVDAVGVYHSQAYAVNQAFKITLTEGADEGAARAIPYSYILEELE